MFNVNVAPITSNEAPVSPALTKISLSWFNCEIPVAGPAVELYSSIFCPAGTANVLLPIVLGLPVLVDV